MFKPRLVIEGDSRSSLSSLPAIVARRLHERLIERKVNPGKRYWVSSFSEKTERRTYGLAARNSIQAIEPHSGVPGGLCDNGGHQTAKEDEAEGAIIRVPLPSRSNRRGDLDRVCPNADLCGSNNATSSCSCRLVLLCLVQPEAMGGLEDEIPTYSWLIR